MRVNLINLTMPKSNNTAFGTNEVVRDEVADAFPLGVEVDANKIGDSWLIRFPENDPLPGNVARRFVNVFSEDVVALKATVDGYESIPCIPATDFVNALRIKTKDAVLNVGRIVSEFAQGRAKAKFAQLAQDAAKKV